ncbi:hypothetical protein [Synechocystis sp. PCC 7509]|uniref:hypothetical protein n=1 Tax=Synechocystis sp. PCC 7509 TaxID=927677 RepID=UPI0002ABAC9B|nr:hypothetical protein [Synechocystis sp. PCC 7509]
MLLAQFQEHYPQAFLLSQLLTIYQGKFVVQVSVKIEGVVRATGMAAAETIELAEDQARTRAIALIPTQNIVSPQPPESNSVTFIPKVTDTNLSNLDRRFTPTVSPTENYPEFAPISLKDDLSLTELNSDPVEEFGVELKTAFPNNPVSELSNVTPFIPRDSREDAQLIEPTAVTEPIDLSDTLIAIETELRNLRWTAKQEHNYVQRIYKKESLDLLSTEQLYEFLHYLQVFAQTSKELERLGWDNQQGQDYLMENYNKKSRQYLSYQELKEFLQHLQAAS